MYFSGTKYIRMLFKDFELFNNYYIYWGYHTLFTKLYGKKRRPSNYADRRVYEALEGNNYLADLIKSNESFMAGRFGNSELFIMSRAKFVKDKYLNESDLYLYPTLYENSGLFPEGYETAIEFEKIMIDSIGKCDIQFVWYNILEDYYLKKYLSRNSILTHRFVLDFWNFKKSWTFALQGKKVLVIHPLADAILQQYKKRKKLFGVDNFLPDFEIIALKAIQTIAGQTDDRAPSWFAGLEYMCKKTDEIDFEIALVGCGSYGYPLSAHIKSIGKQVIHMGGVTQILFGIKGGRWDNESELEKFFNEFWIRPSEVDTPKNAIQVEKSCYW